MSIRIKDVSTLQQKYTQRAQAAAPEYTAGVQAPRRDWELATAAAAPTYAAGVTEAIGRGAFEKGVKQAGTEFWQARAVKLGSQRFPQGVIEGAPDWAEQVAPYLAVISGLTLPPRLPKGNPANNQRVAVVTEALAAKKRALS